MSGRSAQDGLFPPDLAGALHDLLGADLLAVQEVDRYQLRSGGGGQPALLAAGMDAVSYRFEETVRGVPGEPGWRAGIGDVPDHDLTPGFGVALLSRRPVSSWHVLRLAPGRGRLPIPIPSRPPQLLWLRDEPRAVVAAVLESPRITVASTHLSFMPARSPRHLLQVRRWLEQLPGPRVLMGDLNLPPGVVHRLMPGWTPLVTGPTFPSPSPRLQLDHLMASELHHDAVMTGSAQIHRMPISDHCAVTVDLALE